MKRLRPSDKTHCMILDASLPLKSRVDFGRGIRHKAGNILKQIDSGKNVLLLSQRSLPPAWLNDLRNSISQEGYRLIERVLPDGEAAKTMEHMLDCFKIMQANEFARNDSIVAVGGGALTDISGFCAATYLRGIKSALLPTTLLAQVDAAIGGKCGINLEAGKNLAGSFHFPSTVIVDPEVLSTLSSAELQSGMGEIIKYAYIEDTVAQATDYRPGPKPLLTAIADNFPDGLELDNPFLDALISICIRMKLAVVLKDPYEARLRRCLNLGHTLAHGIEKVTRYKVSHGEAVALGLVFAFKLSRARGLIDLDLLNSVEEQLHRLKLPVKLPAGIEKEDLVKAVAFDKKRQDEFIKMVLPEKMAGLVNIDSSVSIFELGDFIRSYD